MANLVYRFVFVVPFSNFPCCGAYEAIPFTLSGGTIVGQLFLEAQGKLFCKCPTYIHYMGYTTDAATSTCLHVCTMPALLASADCARLCHDYAPEDFKGRDDIALINPKPLNVTYKYWNVRGYVASRLSKAMKHAKGHLGIFPSNTPNTTYPNNIEP